MKNTKTVALSLPALLGGAGWMAMSAQDPAGYPPAIDKPALPVSDPSCTFFSNREKFAQGNPFAAATALTNQVAVQLAATMNEATSALPSAPGGSRTDTLQ